MTFVRKILVASNPAALDAQVGQHLEGFWRKVGALVVQPPGPCGYGEFRQVMEKEMLDAPRISFFFADDLAEAC